MQKSGSVEAGGWGRRVADCSTNLRTMGKKWFLTKPAFSGRNALTTNRVSPFSEQGLRLKGTPLPHHLDKPWEFERRRSLGTKRAKSDTGVWAAKGAPGSCRLRKRWGQGVEISPGSRGGPHHGPFSETWLLSLWQEQSLGDVGKELAVIIHRANTKDRIGGGMFGVWLCGRMRC